ncbi:DUF5362 family protein [Cocleimonas sp. KMM 6892]|uniref:DUF5362 family protein n=1 Tax=unclassified Cocleimonas TaxID=2639732 RepID=UPI002DB8935C|nr:MULTISPECIES: DUF5362 family protein [unclassified Cocleimonas]MEB8430914.1 DUF5362 family protein [Cocleimonas sp. KMM 6892]MEC4714314.1 DUF5362 family protein [Cocleimonas sp. KMM 6895]MEC4743645.1 DUF5362 family protein [Cocleimonas sp. KMM 6896]
MSSNVNDAFATPKSDVAGTTIGNNNSGNAITTGIVDQLKRTRPWVLLISIVGFIFTALMAIGTVGIFFGGGAAMMGGPGMPSGIGGGGLIIGMGVMYLIMTILYFVISLFLLKYAGAIKRFVASGTAQDMEAALKHQASFWKLIGILTLLTIVIMIVMMVVGIGGALMGGAF